jgi:hypothetical protein
MVTGADTDADAATDADADADAEAPAPVGDLPGGGRPVHRGQIGQQELFGS